MTEEWDLTRLSGLLKSFPAAFIVEALMETSGLAEEVLFELELRLDTAEGGDDVGR